MSPLSGAILYLIPGLYWWWEFWLGTQPGASLVFHSADVLFSLRFWNSIPTAPLGPCLYLRLSHDVKEHSGINLSDKTWAKDSDIPAQGIGFKILNLYRKKKNRQQNKSDLRNCHTRGWMGTWRIDVLYLLFFKTIILHYLQCWVVDITSMQEHCDLTVEPCLLISFHIAHYTELILSIHLPCIMVLIHFFFL